VKRLFKGRGGAALVVHEWLASTCHPHSRDEIVRVGLSKENARLDLIHPLFLDVD